MSIKTFFEACNLGDFAMRAFPRLLLGVVILSVSILATGAAEASHIFSTNITIDGTPVASGNAFTSPIIDVYVNDPVTFSFDLFGSSGQFDMLFFDAGGSTLPVPTNASTGYNGTGTLATPVVFTFDRTFATAGIFNGRLVPDFPASSPDYRFPGGNTTSNPSIPFQIRVSAAEVPEPASLVLWSVLGTAGIAAWRRKQQMKVA
jgi:hypothetical protein